MIKQALRTSVILLCMIVAVLLIWGCTDEKVEKAEKAEESYQAGVAALKADKTDDAEIEFRKALQLNSEHAQAHFQLGSIYAKSVKEDEIKKAIGHLRAAFKLDDNLNEARKELAVLGFKLRVYSEIIDVCKKYLEKKPDDLDIQMILATSLMNTEKVDEALAILQKTEKANPDNAKVKLSLGRAYVLTDQTDKAREMTEQGASMAPDDITAQILLAGFYEKQKLYPQAEATLKAIKQKFSDKPTAYQVAAMYYIRRKQLPEAEASLKEAIEQHNLKKTFLFHDLAIIQHSQKKFDDALQSLEQAVALEPGDQKSLVLLADYYLKRNKIDQAIATYEKISDKWPEIKEVKSKIAELLMAQKKDDKAKAYIDQILKDDPNSAPDRILQGQLLMKQGQKDQAKAAFAKAQELDPESGWGNFFYGLTLLDDKDYKKSRDALEKAVAKKPQAINIRMALAYANYKIGKTEAALDEINVVLEKLPDNLRARALRGLLYLRLKNMEKARADYQFMLTKKPESVFLQFRLAEIDYALGNKDKALKGFKALVNKYPSPEKPEPSKTIAQIVRIYLDKKQFKKAIKICDTQLKKNPKDLATGMIKAVALLKSKKEKKAKKVLAGLIKQHPKEMRPILLLARIEMGLKEFDAALKTLSKAIAVKPQNAWPYMQMAGIYQRKKMPEKAIETYEALLKVKETYPPAENDLAYLYAETNQNMDRALALAENAVKKMPKNPAVADTLGYVHLKRGALPLAKKYFDEAIAKFPKESYFHFHLAMVLQQQGKNNEAEAALQKAEELGLGKTEKKNIAKIREALKKTKSAKPDWKKAFDEAMQGKKYDNAIKLAKAALDATPSDPEAADALGRAYMAKGSALMAKRYFGQAIQNAPDKPIFHYHLGMAYHKEKNAADARKSLKAAIDKGLSGQELENAKKILAELK
ncbi:tetratricopeptide repeat protein [Desulfococcaceae bacterium HSG7]|nr:tetratricopeptide repeat protein [Desulfococcaceae bacterium HSG7]